MIHSGKNLNIPAIIKTKIICIYKDLFKTSFIFILFPAPRRFDEIAIAPLSKPQTINDMNKFTETAID